MQGAYGPVPLSFTELAAWQALTAKQLAPFEVVTLRKMSVSYCSMVNNPDESCPYQVEIEPTAEELEEANKKAWDSWKMVAKHI